MFVVKNRYLYSPYLQLRLNLDYATKLINEVAKRNVRPRFPLLDGAERFYSDWSGFQADFGWEALENSAVFLSPTVA